MIPRIPPKVYHLLVKTHTTTVLATMPPTNTVQALKEEVFSALTADVNEETDTPKVTELEDFELCKAIKERGKPITYKVLDNSSQLKAAGVLNWEHIYIQFRDAFSGELLPVTFTAPKIDDDDEDYPIPASSPIPTEPSATSKGKRKAPPE
ncbi:hypothetical protein HGRIS_010074 [Hohenbuehelia grisea]|uniref:Uncharacterized protein n=1 Tax=Hohenbuehelia grisea TaxID=104357 RepID=A0ABR3J3N0_9AGAR